MAGGDIRADPSSPCSIHNCPQHNTWSCNSVSAVLQNRPSDQSQDISGLCTPRAGLMLPRGKEPLGNNGRAPITDTWLDSKQPILFLNASSRCLTGPNSPLVPRGSFPGPHTSCQLPCTHGSEVSLNCWCHPCVWALLGCSSGSFWVSGQQDS